MKLEWISASGFRCFDSSSPLEVAFRSGLNVIAGENDAGKTALIDAIRFTLGTRGDNYLRLTEDDFHVSQEGRSSELKIHCTLGSLTDEEMAAFLEWCVIEDGALRLHVHLTAHLKATPAGRYRVSWERRTGTEESGLKVDGELREYLLSTYLRPLRDAERELSPGRRSRLAQILSAMPEMTKEGGAREAGDAPPTLMDIIKDADDQVAQNTTVKGIEKRVNEDYFSKLSFDTDKLKAVLSLGAETSLQQILERLELVLRSDPPLPERVRRGLGMNNALFMAAELLLLQSETDRMGTLLIEEPEAHLHPQLQARFMQMLEEQLSGDNAPQVILTTHSPLLSAGVDLNSVIICQGAQIYPLAKGCTALEPDDYAFLRRFLDATKANLFFARGVLLVEGDAENLLIPSIAKALGHDLTARGVSIVNVGHTGLFRYARVFQGVEGKHVPVPVACIGDRDIPTDIAKTDMYPKRHRPKKTEADYSADEKAERENAIRKSEGGHVKVFISPQWTLEHDLALSGLAVELHRAVWLARAPAGKTHDQIISVANAEIAEWQAARDSAEKIAARIYLPMRKGTVSKAKVAEQLAWLLDRDGPSGKDLETKLPGYLVNAIKYVTSSIDGEDPVPDADTAPDDAAEPDTTEPTGVDDGVGDVDDAP